MKNFLKISSQSRRLCAIAAAAVIALATPAGVLSAQSAAPSLNGVWEAVWGHTIGIDGNTAVYVEISVQTRWQDAVFKGYIKVGDQKLRNIARTGDLTWTGQDLDLTFDTSAPDAATGVIWRNCTITLSADGQTLVLVTIGKDYPVVMYTRKL